MKYPSLLSVMLFSLALQAQSVNSSTDGAGSASSNLSRTSSQASAGSATKANMQAGQMAASSEATSNVSAELTKKVDTKNAKVGDQVFAKTTSSTSLADGTKLPKGTKLAGQVTDVHARSSADKSSHLAFSMDRAILHDGREVPIHATLTSLSAPPSAMAAASTMDDIGVGGGGAMASAGGSGGARASSGGGLLSGATRATGGAVGSSAGLAGGAASSVNRVGSGASGAVQPTAGAGLNGTRAAGGLTGNGLTGNANGAGALQFDRVPVGNLPGVTFSSVGDANSAGSLDAAGRNIELENGTQMGLNVSASRR